MMKENINSMTIKDDVLFNQRYFYTLVLQLKICSLLKRK